MTQFISVFLISITLSITAHASTDSSLGFIYDYWWVLVMIPGIMLLKNIFNKMDDSNEEK